MPIYTYLEAGTGQEFDQYQPIQRINDPIYHNGHKCKRIMSDRFAIPAGHPSPIDLDTQMRKGYKRLEEKQQLRQGGATYSKNTLKKLLW